MSSIRRQTTVVRDGHHNAFTDLQYWQSLYWISYRKGAGHVSMDGEVVVSVSSDRARFREVAHLKVPGDNRDPKFVPMAPDRMALIFPSSDGRCEWDSLDQYVSFSSDGFHWDAPRRLPIQRGLWLWRVRKHGELYYGMVYGRERKDHPRSLMLMTSPDMLEWRYVAHLGREEMNLNESDITFRPDGTAWVIARAQCEPQTAFFFHAAPPYTQWQGHPLPAMIQSPIIFDSGSGLYVAGRYAPALEGIKDFPWDRSLAIWKLSFGKIEPVLRIPACGDCAYPGLAKDADGRICMSYYSQHAYYMGVVPGETPFPNKNAMPADVYFAELDL